MCQHCVKFKMAEYMQDSANLFISCARARLKPFWSLKICFKLCQIYY